MNILFLSIIIGIFIFYFLIYPDFKVKKKREKRLREYNIKRDILLKEAFEIIDKSYFEIISQIKKKYPKIMFDYVSCELVKAKLLEVPDPVTKGLYMTIGESLIPFILKVKNDFVKFNRLIHPVEINTNDSRFLIYTSFWNSEQLNRVTLNGINPKDWGTRREIVWIRDNKTCLRCGTNVELEHCHIHHLQRRSEGGNHSLNNLITLCKDCHTLMEGHEKMKYYRKYRISSKKVHTLRCRYAQNSKILTANYADLRERGYIPCRFCQPWEYHYNANYYYIYDIERNVQKIIDSTLGLLCNTNRRMDLKLR